MLKLFLTGVEQNNDKSFVTAGLASTMQSLGFSSGVYKPVITGAVETNGYMHSKDLINVKLADPYVKTYFTYMLKEDISPILSAAAEKIEIEKNVILKDFQSIENINECLIVEGTSGLATPMGKNFLEEDITSMLDLPVLFVVSALNSDINNTLLSINRAKEKNIELRGIILNNYPKNNEKLNIKLMPKLIEEYTDAKVLGTIPFFKNDFNPNDLIVETLNGVEIQNVFKIKISKLS